MKKFLLIFLLGGTFVMIGVMIKTGGSLKTSLTPLGILNLEFAHNAKKAGKVIDVWASMSSVDNIKAAKLNTGLDFIFLFFYSSLLFYLCRELAASTVGSLNNISLFMAKSALAAGMLDVFENTGMLLSLNGHITNTVALFTFICSIVKWALVLSSLAFILFAGPFILYKKIIQKH